MLFLQRASNLVIIYVYITYMLILLSIHIFYFKQTFKIATTLIDKPKRWSL